MKLYRIILLASGALLLGGWAVALSVSQKAATTPPAKFELTVEDIEFNRTSRQQIHVALRVGHKGPAPSWWNHSAFVLFEDIRVISTTGKESRIQPWSMATGHYDNGREQYVASCLINGSAWKAADKSNGTFKANVVLLKSFLPRKVLASIHVSTPLPEESKNVRLGSQVISE
jgi:hypothetical protein